MMYIFHITSFPIIETDTLAWLCLSHITGETPIPLREKMLEANNRDLLKSMHDSDSHNKEYSTASDAMFIDPLNYYDLEPDKVEEYLYDNYFLELRDAHYRISFGDKKGLTS